jgi:hypothetical protein
LSCREAAQSDAGRNVAAESAWSNVRRFTAEILADGEVDAGEMRFTAQRDNAVPCRMQHYKVAFPLGTAPIVVTSNTTVPNLTATNHPTVFGCGSNTTCPGSSQLSSGATVALHTLIGSVSAPTGSVTVNFGTVGFTSLSTYVCTANANLNGAIVSVSQTTGTSVTFNVNATAATVNYICIGN